MLTKLHYTVSKEVLQEAAEWIPQSDFKSTINAPTNRFFYDLWELKPEYVGTPLEKIYKSLPLVKGEARIIVLSPGQCYQCHSDIDDRYHLNIQGHESFLIDIDNLTMYETKTDGVWHEMNAGVRHTAANFGQVPRIQLVIRKLLLHNELLNPVKVKLTPARLDANDARFWFDQHVSIWLNYANKNNLIANFDYTPTHVGFDIEHFAIDDLKKVLNPEFEIEIL